MESGGENLDPCVRCLQPVPHDARTCPNCGMPRTRTRRFTLSLGLIGLVALIFVVVVMVKAMHDADMRARQQPATDDDIDSTAPPPNVKLPPLNQ